MLKGVCYKPGDHVGALEINGHTNNKIIQIIKLKRQTNLFERLEVSFSCTLCNNYY